MTRWIVGFALALGLTFTVPLADQAKADGYYRPVHKYSAGAVFTHKRCIAARDQVTWICNASEKCCYDWLLRRGACVAGGDRCI